MTLDDCLKCGTSLRLQDELELAPVSTKKGNICARCYREMSNQEIKVYVQGT